MKLTITRHHLLGLAAAALLLCWALPVQAVRIKDIATFSGVRDNQLIGYGLVVGLAGTGDKKDSVFTLSSMKNMMDRMGVGVDSKALKIKNVASVMVTARMPVSAKPGSRLDVTVSSVGDATSLLGGVLLQTALKGVDGKTYTLAQGPLTVGGFSVTGAAASVTKNINTVGLIPGGGIVERAIPFEFNQQDKLTLNMRNGDFSTAQQIAERLNTAMGGPYARAVDGGTVSMEIPPQYKNNLVPLMASVENLEVNPDTPAKVVVDEKTGTVVLGGMCASRARPWRTAICRSPSRKASRSRSPEPIFPGADRGHAPDRHQCAPGRSPPCDGGGRHPAGTGGRPERHRSHATRSDLHFAHPAGVRFVACRVGGNLR